MNNVSFCFAENPLPPSPLIHCLPPPPGTRRRLPPAFTPLIHCLPPSPGTRRRLPPAFTPQKPRRQPHPAPFTLSISPTLGFNGPMRRCWMRRSAEGNDQRLVAVQQSSSTRLGWQGRPPWVEDILRAPAATALRDGDGGMLDLPRLVRSVVCEEWTAEVIGVELVRRSGRPGDWRGAGAARRLAEEEMDALLQAPAKQRVGTEQRNYSRK